ARRAPNAAIDSEYLRRFEYRTFRWTPVSCLLRVPEVASQAHAQRVFQEGGAPTRESKIPHPRSRGVRSRGRPPPGVAASARSFPASRVSTGSVSRPWTQRTKRPPRIALRGAQDRSA